MREHDSYTVPCPHRDGNSECACYCHACTDSYLYTESNTGSIRHAHSKSRDTRAYTVSISDPGSYIVLAPSKR